MSPYFLHLLHSMRRTLCLTLMSAVFSTAARPPLPLDLRPSGGTRKIRSASTSSFAAMQTGRCGCHLLSLGAHCAQEALGEGWVGTGLRLRSRRECVDDALSVFWLASPCQPLRRNYFTKKSSIFMRQCILPRFYRRHPSTITYHHQISAKTINVYLTTS